MAQAAIQRSARGGPSEPVQSRRDGGDLGQIRKGEGDDLALDRRFHRYRPGPHGPYGLDRQLRQHSDPETRADQADDRRVVIRSEVDPGVKPALSQTSTS